MQVTAHKFTAPLVLATLVSGTMVMPAAAEPLVGQVVLFSGSVCPGGWLPADGRLVAVQEYPELYAVIGNTYGGDASAMGLPDLRGRFVMGNPDKVEAVGVTGGARLTANNLPAHKHSLSGVTLSGSVKTVAAGGTSATPSSGVALANTNRTAAYAAGTPSVSLANGTASVTGTSGSATQNNASSSYDGYPPYQILNYCIATGGDTAPLIEAALTFDATTNSLSLARVDYSGFDDGDPLVKTCVENGDLCLDVFDAYSITRPNVRIRLVGDNACKAYDTVTGYKPEPPNLFVTGTGPYPGELRLTGVQIAFARANKADVVWGDHFLAMRDGLASGKFSPADSSFTYTSLTDRNGRPGFLAVDLVDERTLVFENRQTTQAEFQYRVEAQCGEGDSAYEVYFDPTVRHSGRGGGSSY